MESPRVYSMEYPAVYRYGTKKAWKGHWLAFAALSAFGGGCVLTQQIWHHITFAAAAIWSLGCTAPLIWHRLRLEETEVVLLDDRIELRYPLRFRLVIMNEEIEGIDVLAIEGQGLDLFWRGRKFNVPGRIDCFNELRAELMTRVSLRQSMPRSRPPLPTA